MREASGIKGKSLCLVLPAIFSLIFAMLACSFDLGLTGTPPDDTEVAQSVEETLISEQALTRQALDSGEAPEATDTEPSPSGVQETIQAQQATLDAQATLIAQGGATSTPVQPSTPAPTELQVSAAESISLVEWKARNMLQKPGCGEDSDGPPCWFGRAQELELVLEEPVYIDPAWQSPYLVFSQRFDFALTGSIYAKVDGGWETLWAFPSGKLAWHEFSIDLSKYKGEEIIIQFYVTGVEGSWSTRPKPAEWYVRDPQIVPNFDPYQ